MGELDRERRMGDREMAAQLGELRADISDLKEQIDALAQAESAQTAATAELVEAWNTGTGVVKFVKWLASVIGALGVLWAVFHADTETLIKSIFK